MFYGCIRYQDFLKVFIKKLYETARERGALVNRNDQVLYQIFSYMIFFRLEELAPEDLRKLIMSQDAIKMHGFLQFIFDTDALRDTGVREGWMDLYDF